MYAMLTVTNVCGISLSVVRLKLVAHAVYAACCVHGCIQCSLCQMLLASCSPNIVGCCIAKQVDLDIFPVGVF